MHKKMIRASEVKKLADNSAHSKKKVAKKKPAKKKPAKKQKSNSVSN